MYRVECGWQGGGVVDVEFGLSELVGVEVEDGEYVAEERGECGVCGSSQ